MSLRRSKVHQNSSSLNEIIKEAQENSDPKTVSRKVFVVRNSLLTDLMQNEHFQSLYNMCFAVSCLFIISTIAYYVADPTKFYQEIGAIRWGATKFNFLVVYWFLLQILAYGAYEALKLWIFCRMNIHEKISDRTFLALYMISFISLYVITAYIAVKIQFPPITGFAVTLEQVRISMKVHSFVRENVHRVRRRDLEEVNPKENLYPTTKHYFYYLFAPTLIYKDSYPQTDKILWKSGLFNIFTFFLGVVLFYCALIRVNYSIFKNAGLQPFSRTDTALIFSVYSVASGGSFMFILFYGFFHCWFNAAADFLRFGDRKFYEDWWNSSSTFEYHRKWNSVIYDWLHAYIYRELRKKGISKLHSATVVFIISALIHEYVICLSLGIFYPVQFVIFISTIFTMFMKNEEKFQIINFLFWIMLFVVTGAAISCYFIEWFARINCPKNPISTIESLYGMHARGFSAYKTV